MIHGDDKGAVFPPRVAEYQVALIPLGLVAKTKPEDKEKLLKEIVEISQTLSSAGIRVECDTRSHYTAGWKMSEYELRGIPLRIEYGPKDAANGVVTTVRRDTGEKGVVPVGEVTQAVAKLLEQIQDDMFQKAKKSYDEHIKSTQDWSQVVGLLSGKNVIRMPHCGDGACADAIKKETAEMTKVEDPDPRAPSMGAKGEFLHFLFETKNKGRENIPADKCCEALCVPFVQAEVPQGAVCIRPACGKTAINWTQFGRSY
jgi:prolyl-tRNA synthetase